jgi:hypothetical protein
MQAAVAASFVVIEAQALLELAVVVLDAPAQLGELHEPADRGVGGQVREPVLDGLVLAARPFGQQPALGQHPVVVALCVVGRPDAQRDEVAAQRAAVTVAPADGVCAVATCGEDQLAQVARRVRRLSNNSPRTYCSPFAR